MPDVLKTGAEPHYDLSNYMLTSKISYISVHTHTLKELSE
jgi:hypothetical protein